MKKDVCSFPQCGRPVVSFGLCMSHNQQRLRGRELTPLRGAHGQIGEVPKIRLPGVAVSAPCVEALEHRGPNVSTAMRDVLEEWAASQNSDE